MNHSLHTANYLEQQRAAGLDREIALRLLQAQRPPRAVERPATAPTRTFPVWAWFAHAFTAPQPPARPRTH